MTRLPHVLLGAYYTLLIALPTLVFAQSGIPKQIVPCNGTDCTCSHIVTLIQNIINTGIVLVVILSALLFAYAGFLYLTNEAVGMQQQAKSIFKNVALGLVIMLSAWLIVDTLMKTVLGGSFGPWNAVQPVQNICTKLGIT